MQDNKAKALIRWCY